MTRLFFEGLAELRAELRRLPGDLAAEATTIIFARAERAKADIVAAYPERSGDLKNHVSVSKANAGKYGAGVFIKNTAKHAWLFENGSQARHTAIGANRGAMPPGHVFVPIVMRQRRAMYADLKALLARKGLQVRGDVAA
jgi:hypothetical protein